MTGVDLCRVTVRTLRPTSEAVVDLALPTRLEVGELLPDIVDLVGEPAREGERWTLSRFDGSVLDESATLKDSGVEDGDVLLLSDETSLPTPRYGDMSHYVLDASTSADRDTGSARRMGPVTLLWSAAFGATTLALPGPATPDIRGVIAVMLTVAMTVAAVIASRVGGRQSPASSLGATAVVFGAAAGYLVVPGHSAAPKLFLAAAVCGAVSTLLLRLTSGGTPFFVSLAAMSTMTAVAAAVVAMWPTSTATAGAVLTAASLVMMGVAARLSIFLAGLAPRMSSTDEAPDETISVDVGATCALRGHEMLTGLLAGFSLSAASGAVLIAGDCHSPNTWSGVALTAATSVVLMFRAAQQRGAVRSAAVFVAGLISTTATFTLTALSAPQHRIWLCLIAVAFASGCLWFSRVDVRTSMSPLARRGLEVVDYLVLAAVVPLACWVGGVFGFVRGLSLA
jgi:type VII secretion integral membrane protein EccD